MASLTVRQLDEALKKRLRLRAAKHGRSVEDEVRTILRSAAADDSSFAAAPDAPAKPAKASDATTRKALLVIAGGIAAYKSLDLIRRRACGND
jgi:phosphopantothenoylcysteine decarboxylase/phosphopantothenate--cysteine ligase